MKQKVIFLAGFILFSAQISHAQQTCISGSATGMNLINQLEEAKKSSSITKIISAKYNLNSQKTEACLSGLCETKIAAPHASVQIKNLQKMVLPIEAASGLLFKKDCLMVSNTFRAATAQIDCPGNSKSSELSCINEEQLTYQNAVISNFSACTQQEGIQGVDGKALFEMFSKESGFRPNYAYTGGVGIGQLTNIFVEDIHQKHRGHRLLKTIADSKNPDCMAAKLIAAKDLHTKPSLSDRCSFISTGEGMERNILYTLVGMANSWQKDIRPVLKNYLDKYSDDPQIDDVKHLALLNAYGPGGRGAARAAISRLSALKPDQFVKAMKKPLFREGGKSLTVYTTNLANRQKNIAAALPEPIKSEFNKTGANACINSPL
ncbi:MAG: hypothetical protein H7328_03330 [Bdellovibrio sp.]|nr:hypothetical protein [Bdellovibrio sp.]